MVIKRIKLLSLAHNTVEQMKEAILEILNSKELQEKMKTEGLKHAQNFTDHEIADNLMKVYTSL